MKIKVWVVTTCIPEPGEGPCLPSVFGTEAEAEAYADEMLREEWEQYGPIDEEADDGTVLPYPGHWRDANDEIKRRIGDGSWGEWQITSHEIEVVGAAGPSSPEYLDRFPPEARVHADRAYQDGYEDGGEGAEALATALDNILAECTGEHGHGNALVKARAIAEAAIRNYRDEGQQTSEIDADGRPATAPAELYPGTGWTDADSAAALAEGWAIFERSGDGTLQIQADDDAGKIADDSLAVDLVKECAEGGSDLHRRALAIHIEGAAERAAWTAGWRPEGDGRFVVREEPDTGHTREAGSWLELCKLVGIEVLP